jgi:hypothetical protein
MSNQEQITKLAELANSCHQIEQHFKELPFFTKLPYNVISIERAVHHIEHARMYAGDLLRLAVLGADHRKEMFFNVEEHGGRFTGVLQDFETSMYMVKWAKRELRALFYIVCDEIHKVAGFLNHPGTTVFSEWDSYFIGLRQHLKAADQCLGLWIGEITTEQPAPPPSNATQLVFTVPQIEYLRLQKAELFDAIMADLAPEVLADFGEGVKAAYQARKVEQVLRKHLGLPNPQSAIPNPQS